MILAKPDAAGLWANITDAGAVRSKLASLGVRDPERAARDLIDITALAAGSPALAEFHAKLERLLPECADAGMALSNLERFLRANANPQGAVSELAAAPRTTEALLQILSTSQAFSELLIAYPTYLPWLRAEADRRDRETMVRELLGELEKLGEEEKQKPAIRRFRLRETLRIGHEDIVRERPLELITTDISSLAEACVEVAVEVALRQATVRFGRPRTESGAVARFAVLALGKLGGGELNYSSDIDLVFLYDFNGMTEGGETAPVSCAECFARAAGQAVRLLSDHTEMGPAYRVDMRLRPEGAKGAIVRSLAATLGYYETMGRTWERQALIKCRPIAGALDLGREFIEAIRPFVYRRYLGASEINEIKAMKRRIELRTKKEGSDELDVKTGRGGIRDVEFVVQFLQLLHGGQYPEVRHANTLAAINRLESVGCLSARERGVMEDTYRFLRKIEHRLQIMFDLQTHTMPQGSEEQRSLAVRMGYKPLSAWEDGVGPAERFLLSYRDKTEENRRILNHLLHDAFRDDGGATVEPVVDLVLDPDPDPARVETALAPYPFRDRSAAAKNLFALAREESPFLSPARCRHFFAAIAPRLLDALAQTADPDRALVNLEKVSASLGAKAVLWELFSFNPPTLRLYVEICAVSELLSEILIGNPGMIDDLMDSLVLDRSLPASVIRSELAELCRNAEDPHPILQSFRNKEWIRIGTRDILGREPIREALRELSDVAQAIVDEIATAHWTERVARRGAPKRALDGKPARWAIIALGKFGGREPAYQSDLDLVFFAETKGEAASGVSNEQFFNELAQRVIAELAGQGAAAPLYCVDTRLRPHGGSGPLIVSLEALADYFQTSARAWELLAYTRARVIHSTGGFGKEAETAIKNLLAAPRDPVELAASVVAMRSRLEHSRSSADLKRGVGGLADIEFTVQYLQLTRAAERPEVIAPNIWKALDLLKSSGTISSKEYMDLKRAYTFFRSLESRHRLVRNRTGSELLLRDEDLERLIPATGDGASEASARIEAVKSEARDRAARAREIYNRYVVAAAAGAKAAPDAEPAR